MSTKATILAIFCLVLMLASTVLYNTMYQERQASYFMPEKVEWAVSGKTFFNRDIHEQGPVFEYIEGVAWCTVNRIEATPIGTINDDCRLYVNETSRTAYVLIHGQRHGRVSEGLGFRHNLATQEEKQQPHRVAVEVVLKSFSAAGYDSTHYDRVVVFACYPGCQENGQIKVGDKTFNVEYCSTAQEVVRCDDRLFKNGFIVEDNITLIDGLDIIE